MNQKYLKILMILSLVSAIFSGCSNAPPKKIAILIDISKSNKLNIKNTLSMADNVYQLINPKDTIDVYFFSSVKYLAYSGGKLNKDREFPIVLEKGYKKAEEILVENGTYHSIVKEIIEKNSYNKTYIFTDGFFENSKVDVINNSSTLVFVIGLNILNNEKIINSFSSQKNLIINYEGSSPKLQ